MKKRRSLVKILTLLSTVAVIFVALAVPCLAAPADNIQPLRPVACSFDLVSSVILRDTRDRSTHVYTSVFSTSQNGAPRYSTDTFDGQSVWCDWTFVDAWDSYYNYEIPTSVFGEYYSGFSNRLDTLQNNYQYRNEWHYDVDIYETVSEAFDIVPRGTFVNLIDARYSGTVGQYVSGWEYDYTIHYNQEAYNGVYASSMFPGSDPLCYVNSSNVAEPVEVSYTSPSDGYKLGDVFTVAPVNSTVLRYAERPNGFESPIWTVRFTTVVGLDYNGYVGDSTREIIYVEPPDVNFSFTSWLGTAISGFVSFQLFPGFSIGALLTTLISFSCVMWFLKLVAGG